MLDTTIILILARTVVWLHEPAADASLVRPEQLMLIVAAVLLVVRIGLSYRDTTCAIVGGIVTSFVGVEGIPTRWLACREGLPNWAAWMSSS